MPSESGTSREIIYTAIAFLSYVLVGCGRSFNSFLFEQLDATMIITDEEKSWIASLPYFFNPLGCLIGGVIMDSYGRKKNVQYIFIMFVLCWVITACAETIPVIYFGMILQGIAGGMSFCISTYVSEISAMRNRGFMLCLLEPLFSGGVLLSNLLVYILEWHVVSLIYAVLSSLAFILSTLICESPLWLFSKNRTEISITTLEFLRKQDSSSLTAELQEMEKFRTKEQKSVKNTLMDVGKTWKPLLLVSFLYIFEQNGGLLMFVSYTLKIVQSLKVPFDSSTIVIVYSIVGFLSSCCSPFFVHKFNRKTVASVSTIGMGLAVLLMAVYEETFLTSKDKPYAWIIPVALYFYNITCYLGVLPLSFAVGSEMFPQEVRGVMNGLYGVIAYLYVALSTKVFPAFLSLCGIKVVLWVFCGFSFLSCVFYLAMLPETRGKSFSEVQQEINEGVPIRKMFTRRRNGYVSIRSSMS